MSAPAELEAAVPVGRREAAFVVALLVVLVVANLAVAARTSETIDERFHVGYGRRLLYGHPERIATFDSSKMPVSALNALPSVIADRVPAGAAKNLLGGLAAARGATILAAALLALLLWRWSRDLYGPAAGGAVLFLTVADPNLLAHSHLATTDVYTTLGLVAALWGAWRLGRRPDWPRTTAEALLLGGAQLTKYFALILYPLLAGIELARARWAATPTGAPPSRRLLRLGIAAAGSVLVIHLGFAFDRSFSTLADHPWMSSTFQRLAGTPVVSSVPIPLPDAYVVGFDMARDAERELHTYGRVYLLGRTHDGGVPGYYLVASLVKTPIPVLLLAAVALWRWLRRFRDFDFWNDEIYLAAPLVVFVLYFNFFYAAQIGIRHYLIVHALGYVLCGTLLRDGWPHARRSRLALAALAAWLVVSVASAFPHYIPYFNELVPDRKFAYRILADSNVDWGQATGALRRWLAKHPEARYAPKEPVAGTVVVGVNSLTGVLSGERFAWLRPLSPVDHVAYSFLVFEVPEEVARAARQAAPPEPAP